VSRAVPIIGTARKARAEKSSSFIFDLEQLDFKKIIFMLMFVYQQIVVISNFFTFTISRVLEYSIKYSSTQQQISRFAQHY